MEIKETLIDYTDDERTNFIVQYNHQLGYDIKEYTTTEILEEEEIITKHIEAWGYTEKEKQQQEREMIDNLELTGADVERAIYEAKGMDFEDLVQFVIDSELVGFDVKRLKIELKANHFVRKHPYINIIGSMLGYTPDDMDYLFENKRFPEKETPSDTQEVENID